MINWHSYHDKLLSIEFNIKNARILLVFNVNFFSKPFVFEPLYHNHLKHEFFFVNQGECVIRIDGKDYLMQTKSFIGVPTGINHNVCHKSDDAQVLPVSMQFFKIKKQAGEMDIDFFELLNELVSPKYNPRTFSGCLKVFETFERLSQTFQNVCKPLYQEYFEYTVIQFFIEVVYCMGLESLISKNNKKDISAFTDINSVDLKSDIAPEEKGKQFYTEIIEGYLGNLDYKKTTLSELAEKLQLSVRHTGRLVKQIYNIGFSELFTLTRMNLAKSMILETDLSFDIISEHIGYSYKGFLLAFKRITGKTPTEFRKTAATNRKN